MEDIYRWIDEHRQELVEELQTFLRQPSISSRGEGLDECADLLKSIMIKDGISNARILPVEGGPSLEPVIHILIVKPKDQSPSAVKRAFRLKVLFEVGNPGQLFEVVGIPFFQFFITQVFQSEEFNGMGIPLLNKLVDLIGIDFSETFFLSDMHYLILSLSEDSLEDLIDSLKLLRKSGADGRGRL